ncbi:unnamed protein product [Parajaminaea phylloscopi]
MSPSDVTSEVLPQTLYSDPQEAGATACRSVQRLSVGTGVCFRAPAVSVRIATAFNPTVIAIVIILSFAPSSSAPSP